MSNKTEGAYFAWARGVKGPTPVKYYDGIPDSENKEGVLLAKWKVTDGETLLGFYTLAQRYPCPQPGPDDLWTVPEIWKPRADAA